MGSKTLVLALVLLLPNAISAETTEGTEARVAEPCDVYHVSAQPPNVTVEPDCLRIGYAEESI